MQTGTQHGAQRRCQTAARRSRLVSPPPLTAAPHGLGPKAGRCEVRSLRRLAGRRELLHGLGDPDHVRPGEAEA